MITHTLPAQNNKKKKFSDLPDVEHSNSQALSLLQITAQQPLGLLSFSLTVNEVHTDGANPVCASLLGLLRRWPQLRCWVMFERRN